MISDLSGFVIIRVSASCKQLPPAYQQQLISNKHVQIAQSDLSSSHNRTTGIIFRKFIGRKEQFRLQFVSPDDDCKVKSSNSFFPAGDINCSSRRGTITAATKTEYKPTSQLQLQLSITNTSISPLHSHNPNLNLNPRIKNVQTHRLRHA